MTVSNMKIRHLSFTGPKKETAMLKFGPGLNLIFGPSNTGKSSVLDALDFMLGRDRVLKEIPQHEGYDQVYLGVEFSNNEKYTFIRSIQGGDYECYDGIHFEKPEGEEAIVLRPKVATKKFNTISNFILERLELDEKKLKKNAANKTVRLTLRNLLPVAMVTETDIQKENSPYIGEQYTETTEHKSRLKLLLTGVDDSALLPAEIEKKKLSRTAKIDVIDELISEQEDNLSNTLTNDQSFEELKDQKQRINSTIQQEQTLLEASEEQYNLFISNRTESRNDLERNNERFAEISEMLNRFKLLKIQYQSDMLRLENISEAGSLISVLPSDRCPLCGSSNTEPNDHIECDGNLTNIVSAATSEKQKIANLNADLSLAIEQLESEASSIDSKIPKILIEISSVNEKLSKLNPEITSQRHKYSELLSVRNHVEKALDMFEHLDLLEKKKEQLEAEAPEKTKSDDKDTALPTKALFDLSKSVRDLLQNWNFPNSNDVHFDKETGDFVINGKHRVSNGKGYRAITYAAATLGLMKYAEETQMPHLGFAILDSPLLAYEEPEDEADDLRETDVNVRFLDSLAFWDSRQIIVFENKKSIPDKYTSGNQIVHFTKDSTGRYGFFPTEEKE